MQPASESTTASSTASPAPVRSARRPATSRLGLVGVVLVVIGLALCAAYRFTASDEPHSYAADAVAPYGVSVTQGHTYLLAVHRGVDTERDLGVGPTALSCTYAAVPSSTPGVGQSLPVTPETSSTKATNVIATFRAPLTGSIHVACSGLSAVFVDDADNAPGDRSGLYLLLGVIALGVGVPLVLSALRTSSLPARRESDEDGDASGSDRLGEDDQVE